MIGSNKCFSKVNLKSYGTDCLGRDGVGIIALFPSMALITMLVWLSIVMAMVVFLGSGRY